MPGTRHIFNNFFEKIFEKFPRRSGLWVLNEVPGTRYIFNHLVADHFVEAGPKVRIVQAPVHAASGSDINHRRLQGPKLLP